MRNAIRKHADLAAGLALSLLVAATTLPFLNHAYHIDETLFLRIAQQIKVHPFDPYGFWYLWNTKYEPISQIAAFPPIFSYFLALAGAFQKFPAEWIVHLSLVPFALLASLSFYRLCRQWPFDPLPSFLAAAWLTVSPAFALSANLAMPDVAALGLAMLAFAAAMTGWKNGRWGYLFGSGAALGAAMLMRYNTLPLIPVLFGLGLTFAPLKRALLPSLVSILIFGAWMAVSAFSGGTAHTSEVVSVFASLEGWKSRFWSLGIHLTLTTFIPFLILILDWKKNLFIPLLLFFAAFDFALFSGSSIKQFALAPDLFFFILGLGALAKLTWDFLQEWRKNRLLTASLESGATQLGVKLEVPKTETLLGNAGARDLMLFLWIAGVLCIPIIYVHFASKYLLLAQPPLLLLVLEKFSRSRRSFLKLSLFFLPVMTGLSLLLAQSDFSQANVYRAEAEAIAKRSIAPASLKKNSPLPLVWFTGHWGWQYYMEKGGALALPYEYREGAGPLPGDLIVTSKFASANVLHPNLEKKLEKIDTHTWNLALPLRLMNPNARAGFYSNHWGPLPYNLSATPLEEFNFYRLAR